MAQKINEDHVFYRTPTKYYPTVDRGEGVYIYDKEGRQFIDGSGGAAVVNIGHGVKEVEEAMLKQASRIAFTHGTQFTSEAAIELADRIVKMSPPGLSRVYFLSGGSEAVETAMKMARQYQVDRGCPMKFKVISRWASYHGNTVGALALSGHTGRRRYYLPLMLHTPHIAPCYCYRCPFNLVPEKCSIECADELEKTILYEGPDSVSAFIAEPVVGATAGALVPKDGYFRRIREICDKYDVLFISDEVMSGVGRTGRNWALDHWNVVPDMIVAAKGLASGYTPLYVVVAKEEIHQAHQGKERHLRPRPYLQPEPAVLLCRHCRAGLPGKARPGGRIGPKRASICWKSSRGSSGTPSWATCVGWGSLPASSSSRTRRRRNPSTRSSGSMSSSATAPLRRA